MYMSVTLSKELESQYTNRVDVFSQTERYTNELDILIRELQPQPNHLYLDIGCGSGNAMNYIIQHTGCDAKGIEQFAHYLELSKCRERITIGDGHHLPFADNTFDFVTIIHVIGHVKDPIQVMQEARRVTKPGGKIGIVTPNKWYIFSLRPLNWLGILKYTLDPTRLRLYSTSSLQKDLQKSGWNNIHTFTFGKYPSYLDRLVKEKANFLKERVFGFATKQ